MIRVCDAIMGSGKSRAAMTYMNEHPERRYIYITPYLQEAARIRKGCPRLRFVEPSDKIKEYGYRKTAHTAALISKGANITTTHQAFSKYTNDMLEDIRKYRYVLVIDENVEVIHRFAFNLEDLQIAISAGIVEERDGVCRLGETSYNGACFSGLVSQLRTGELIRVGDSRVGDLFYWEMPIDLFTAFEDVVILTYMFDGQSLHHFLRMYNLDVNHIGVRQDSDGVYRFCDDTHIRPAYVSRLNDMVRIYDGDSMNLVGRGRNALSVGWFQRGGENVDILRRNVYNYYHNIHADAKSNEILWSTYNQYYNTLKGKGFTRGYLAFNAKATNEYRNRDCLAYLVNLFVPVGEKMLYQERGVEINEDRYALSTMVQWIWRSAIRDGRPVDLYVPSERMRTLLRGWINTVAERGC